MNETTITKKEWRFVLLFSIVVMVITILPYLYGYLITPPDKQFMGIHAINPLDTYWYISLIEQAREGKIIFSYPSFSEFQQPIIFHPLFLLMGWFAGIFNIPNIVVYHLFRVLLGFVFLWISYIFISHFLKDVLKRKIAFVLLAIGSGIGWIVASVGKLEQFIPGDLWIKEINGFLVLYEAPLDILGVILILIIFLSFLKLLQTSQMRYALIAGLGLLLLLIVHPYEVFTVLLTLFLYLIYLIISKKIFPAFFYSKNFFIVMLLSLPGIAYNYYAVTASPALNLWLKSAIFPYYSPLIYLGGFGLLVLLSFWAIYKILKQKLNTFYFIVIWLIAAFSFAYQPWIRQIYFQPKFLAGVMIVIAILSAEGIYSFLKYLQRHISKTTAEGLVLWTITFMTFSNIAVIQRDIEYYKMRSWPFYLENDYLSAFDWIKNNAGRSDIILSNRDLAYFIPGITGNPIFFGLLDYYTNDYLNRKRVELKWLFEAPAQEAEKYKFLKDKNIGYFLYAPESLKITDAHKKSEDYEIYYKNYYYDISNFNPEKIIGLKAVYQNSKATIYKVE